MLTGWFKCPVQAWQHVRWLIPKPWPPACMTADVRWWNDQLKMGCQATPPTWEELSELWGVTEEETGRICVAVTEEGEQKGKRKGAKPSRARGARSDRPDIRPDQTSYLKSVSGESGSGAREADPVQPDEELQAILEALKSKSSEDY